MHARAQAHSPNSISLSSILPFSWSSITCEIMKQLIGQPEMDFDEGFEY
jgi:hypothetical protein